MKIKMIPLSQLARSPDNVRKTGDKQSVESLAASIRVHGLLQNLQVRETAKDSYEVLAGAQRLAALKLLVKRKVLENNAKIACSVIDGQDGREISLAENEVRTPMHPADQFEAFKALAEDGKEPEEIAARFGVTAAVVRQRLKLASVSPKLMKLYRGDQLTLDQLMAFTVSDDHAAQELAWFGVQEYNRHPSDIRRRLTAAHIPATSKRARFVGIDTYEAAGGGVIRDLFDTQNEGYLTDAALLDRLAAEKLERDAEAIRAEGWKWVEIIPDCSWDDIRKFEKIPGKRQPVSKKQTADIKRLSAEHDDLCEIDDPSDEQIGRMDVIEEEITALRETQSVWTKKDIARCGAIVSIGQGGKLEVERGLLRSEDRPKDDKKSGDEASDSTKSGDGKPSLSAVLIEDLTAHRTQAIQALLADNPSVALAAVVHALALNTFYSHSIEADSSLGIRGTAAYLRAEGIGESPAATALAEHDAAWTEMLPKANGLWEWLCEQQPKTLHALLAVCASRTVSAVAKPHTGATERQLAHADQLAGALGLDMANWWKPTAASYFNRVSKTEIIGALRETDRLGGPVDVQKLKKGDLATHAEKQVAGTGWLPAILRRAA
jgi:ParB family transcriptional regulator, chromosome partitioning protein